MNIYNNSKAGEPSEGAIRKVSKGNLKGTEEASDGFNESVSKVDVEDEGQREQIISDVEVGNHVYCILSSSVSDISETHASLPVQNLSVYGGISVRQCTTQQNSFNSAPSSVMHNSTDYVPVLESQ